jgi:hypothetical protein
VASLGSSVRIAGRGRAITAGRLSIWGGGLYAYEMNRIEIACCPHCPVGFLIIVALRLSRSVHTVHQTHRESERFDSSVCLFQAHSSLRNRGSSSSFIFLRNEAVTLESPRGLDMQKTWLAGMSPALQCGMSSGSASRTARNHVR